MTALPPPSTSSSGLMHHAAHHSPLHPSLSEAPPSPHHPAATSLPQPLHNHTASLASLAQHLKREIEGLALPQMSPTHRGLDEGAALKSGVGRRHDGGGALMVDDPGFHEVTSILFFKLWEDFGLKVSTKSVCINKNRYKRHKNIWLLSYKGYNYHKKIKKIRDPKG